MAQYSRYDYVRRRGQTLLSFFTDMGPGFLVTIGFIDPGNIAANVVAGATFGYSLLWVVPLGTLILVLFQEMAARLGVVSKACLSEAVCPLVGPVGGAPLGVLAFAGSASTVLAELLGAAVGLNLLFGLPLVVGGALTAIVVGAVIWSQEYHHVEDLIVAMVGLIGLAYLAELFMAKPAWGQVAEALVVPHLSHANAYMAISVLGAIVMPSNLYLHSAIAQTRDWSGERIRHEFFDTTVSMIVGGVINAAIIVVAAAVFYTRGIQVSGLEQAAATLEPIAGSMARVVFAVALVLAGLASAITGSMAGSYAVGGFFRLWRRNGGWHHEKWPFRLGFLAVLVVAVAALFFVSNPLTAMVFSQAILGVLLPFTIIPLLILTGRKTVMGEWANPPVVQALGWVIAGVVIALNGYLVYTIVR
ncbi:MAG TPA: Nramp family divalent metal transporter [Bacillota bacterium]|jgi:manganese transport protein